MGSHNNQLFWLVSWLKHYLLINIKQIRVKTFKNKNKIKKVKKVTFSDFYCLINTKFWIINEKMFIKKVTFSDVCCFISTIVNYK